MATAHQSGTSRSTLGVILKNKKNMMEAVKRLDSLKATKLTKIQQGPVSDREKFLMIQTEDQTEKHREDHHQSKSLFAMLKQGPNCSVTFTASSG